MGGIESEDAPGDVYVGLRAIEMPGYRDLVKGDLVEFQYEEAAQDSWKYRATWVRPMRFKDSSYRRSPGDLGHS
jgi:cold shock CspA family protein